MTRGTFYSTELFQTSLVWISSLILRSHSLIAHFQRVLNVTRVQGNLVLPSNLGSTCGCSNSPAVDIPNNIQTTGVAADLIIFLTGRSTRFNAGNTIAFACPCKQDSTTRRPIAGFINWGPNKIEQDPLLYQEQLGVGLHEIVRKLNSEFH